IDPLLETTSTGMNGPPAQTDRCGRGSSIACECASMSRQTRGANGSVPPVGAHVNVNACVCRTFLVYDVTCNRTLVRGADPLPATIASITAAATRATTAGRGGPAATTSPTPDTRAC